MAPILKKKQQQQQQKKKQNKIKLAGPNGKSVRRFVPKGSCCFINETRWFDLEKKKKKKKKKKEAELSISVTNPTIHKVGTVGDVPFIHRIVCDFTGTPALGVPDGWRRTFPLPISMFYWLAVGFLVFRLAESYRRMFLFLFLVRRPFIFCAGLGSAGAAVSLATGRHRSPSIECLRFQSISIGFPFLSGGIYDSMSICYLSRPNNIRTTFSSFGGAADFRSPSFSFFSQLSVHYVFNWFYRENLVVGWYFLKWFNRVGLGVVFCLHGDLITSFTEFWSCNRKMKNLIGCHWNSIKNRYDAVEWKKTKTKEN